ncbi:UvrD-helicase domain-containing protein [Buchnera aphidicola]|uniref:DNA 3'-5' helicase n=1 Tax=Buchnera aphidicola (Cinara strobi) TaxID=1921549 RepID=A0A3B1E1G6_9GAMM|nr:UvrD-helicase domain-containing protein [Buchnera aphidicola]VAX76905.1 ATP-dependent DNA helicase Rep [Buchnera aphidicola (Cinara strobi)]
MILNEIQKKAIHIINDPCLILAGAGSGKTSVIINKLITLIQIYQYDPKKIIVVTFTNRAAKEIESRLLKILTVKQIQDILVSTFHSLGLKIIRNEYKILGLKSNFTLFDEYDQLNLLKNIIYTSKNDSNLFFLKQLLHQISYWKNKLLNPSIARKFAINPLEKKCIFFYEQYDNFLKRHNILDFNDLIFLPTILLKNNIDARLRWQEKVQYLLVDEYQDINMSQYKLIKLLCGHNSNFTVVGDDDQSIYSWRGAQPDIFYLLKDDFPHLNILKMEQNYRSSGCILNAANILISNNSNVFNKKLFSQLDYGNRIYASMCVNEVNEAQKIIKYICTHKNNNNLRYHDYAILYRSNSQAKIVESELIFQNIPYCIHSGFSFFNLSEIKNLLAYLRLIVNQNDDLAFLRIINTPNRRIGLVTLSKLKLFAKIQKISLFEASLNKKMQLQLKKNTTLYLNNFTLWIIKLSSLLIDNPKIILKQVIQDINYFQWIKQNDKDLNMINRKIQEVIFFSDWLQKTLSGDHLNSPICLEDILIRFTCGELNDSFRDNVKDKSNKLQLMTIHASKGLEFSVVCIIGLEEGTLPHQKSIIDKNVKEERRLMYVGITRAKKQLFLSFCKTKKKFGALINLQPSRFLFELPKEELYWI